MEKEESTAQEVVRNPEVTGRGSDYNSLTGSKYLSVSRMIYISILVAQGLVMFWIEMQIPFNTGIPGAKLGLANIFSLVAIYTLDPLSAFLVVVIRIIMSTLIAKTMVALLYSMTGGILSFIVMFLLVKLGRNRINGLVVSIGGSIFHNLGQVLMASWVLQNPRVLYYFPMMGVIAVPTGIFVGLTASFMIKHIRKLPIYRRISRYRYKG